MSVDHQIADELKTLGYQPQVVEGDTAAGRQRVVIFPLSHTCRSIQGRDTDRRYIDAVRSGRIS